MNVKYINPFLAALQNVFDTIVDMPFTIKKPFIKKRLETSHGVNGVIGISGEVKGRVVVSFPQATALAVASVLLKEHVSKVEQSCIGAISEIANMVVRDAKKDFPVKGTTISISQIIIGCNRSVFSAGVPIISIPCEVASGEFFLEVAVE